MTRPRSLRIVVLIDEEAYHHEDPQFLIGHEGAIQTVEFHVAETLRLLGHEAEVVVCRPPIQKTIDALRAAAPDLVFNLTEHFRGNRQMDRNIAAVLDLLGIPYTGSDPVGLMLCRDKGLCKRLLSHYRIRVPSFSTLPVGRVTLRRKLRFPIIVKPALEDGSDGIALSSLVESERDLRERVLMLHERMRQPVICEEYIQGREIYVGIIGNARLTAFPAREVRFAGLSAGPRFATARVKRDEEYRKKWGIEFTHADLTPDLQARAAHIGKRIYRLLHIRDYGRIDMRITPDGQIVFLEANPNPDLTLGDELSEAAERAGLNYEQLIGRILNQARRRCPAARG